MEISDTLIQTYFNWRPGQPNNYAGDQHYMALHTSNGKWGDMFQGGYHTFPVLCTYIVEGTAPQIIEQEAFLSTVVPCWPESTFTFTLGYIKVLQKSVY